MFCSVALVSRALLRDQLIASALYILAFVQEKQKIESPIRILMKYKKHLLFTATELNTSSLTITNGEKSRAVLSESDEVR